MSLAHSSKIQFGKNTHEENHMAGYSILFVNEMEA